MKTDSPLVSSNPKVSPNIINSPISNTANGFGTNHGAQLMGTNEATNAGSSSDSTAKSLSNAATPSSATPVMESSTRWAQKGAVVSNAEYEASVVEKPSSVSSAVGLRPSFMSQLLAPSSIWKRDWDGEHQREEAYALETLELFRRRLRLVSVMAIIGVIPYTAFYIYLAPELTVPFLLFFSLMFLIAAAAFFLARRLPNISFLRIVCLFSYTSFSVGAAAVLLVMGQQHSLILGGHNHIVLTTLLLPLIAGECLLIGVIALLSLAAASWLTLMPDQSPLFFAHLFTLGYTTIFVLFIAYLQNVLRRHAFDSAFDIVLAAKRLQKLSVKDALTGGYNRRHLENALDVEVVRAVRFERPLSVIMFDLDNFKSVNDSHGHTAGDRVLVEVWNAASTVIREVDTAARYGGDEFAIILPETNEAAALEVAMRLKAVVSARLLSVFAGDSLEAKVTLSAGIVTVRPRQLVPNHEVLALADERLYAAKRNGKNNIAY